MGTKVTVDDLTTLSPPSTIPVINANFDTVADEFDLVLYRDGSLSVSGDLDMDSNTLLNLPWATSAGSPVTLAQFSALNSAAEATVEALAAQEAAELALANTLVVEASVEAIAATVEADAAVVASDKNIVAGYKTDTLGYLNATQDLYDLTSTLATGLNLPSFTDTTIAAAIVTGRAAVADGESYVASGDDVDYIGRYLRVDASNSTEVWTYPKPSAFDEAIIASRAAISETLALGSAGRSLNFITRYGTILNPSSDPIVADVTNAALVTYTRATSTYEQTGPASYTNFVSGAGAFNIGLNSVDQGLAFRRAATNALVQSATPNIAPWTKTNITIASNGTNVFGGSRQRITDDATSGFHRVLQQVSSTIVNSGQTWCYDVIIEAGTITQVELAMGPPFGNCLVTYNLSAQTTAVVTQGNLEDYGIIDLGNGILRLWMRANATSTANSNQQVYLNDGGLRTYVGTGKYVDFHHAQMTQTEYPVSPIITAASTVARNADVMYFSESGNQNTFLLDVRDEFLQGDGFAFNWHDGTADNQVALLNNAGVWTLRRITSGVTTDYVGPSVSVKDKVVVSYNQVTGEATWCVNGTMQTSFSSGGPPSLTTVNIGSDHANVNQINAVFADFEITDGTATTADMQAATGGSSGSVSATAYDWDDVFIQPNGSGGWLVFHPLKNSSDGLDYVKWNIEQKDDGAGNPYFGSSHPDPTGATAGEGSQGLSDGGAWHVRRTGDTSFGSNIQQLMGNQTAMFDSTIEEGAQALSGSFFWAVVKTNSNHGNMLETSVRVMADGVLLTSASPITLAKNIEIIQTCKATSFVDGRHLANRIARYIWSGQGFTYIPTWEWLDSASISRSSYPLMLGTKAVSNLYTDASFLSEDIDLTVDTGLENSIHNMAVVSGGGYSAKLVVETADDSKRGFLSGESIFRVDTSVGTNTGKVYLQHYATAGGAVAVVAGDIWRHVGHYEFGLT